MRATLLSILAWIIVGCGGTSSSIGDSNGSSSTTDAIFSTFGIGIGMSGAFAFDDGSDNPIWLSSSDLILNDKIDEVTKYQSISKFDGDAFKSLQSKLKNSKYIVYWVTKDWEEYWIDATELQKVMDAGYIPVFNYWYFGDDLVGGLPDDAKIDEYYKHNQKLSTYLQKLHGKKIVIIEPEFNKDILIEHSTKEQQIAFANVLGSAIDTIKSSVSDTLFSISMIDTGRRGTTQTSTECGYSSCALGDKEIWAKAENIYDTLLSKLDFVSFSEMLGQFSRDDDNPGDYNNPNPKAYTIDEMGMNELDSRVSNLAKFMNDKYKKPVFLSHIAIATATWSDTNSDGDIDNGELDMNGWNDIANSFYRDIISKKDELLTNRLFGLAVMELFDNPQHDKGGYQYFINNEYHLGIVGTSAVDETDEYLMGDIVPKSNIVDTLFSE